MEDRAGIARIVRHRTPKLPQVLRPLRHPTTPGIYCFQHFAASPDEPVRALALMSTLMPHLSGLAAAITPTATPSYWPSAGVVGGRRVWDAFGVADPGGGGVAGGAAHLYP